MPAIDIVRCALRHRNRDTAAANAKVNGRIQLRIVKFVDNVGADDTNMRRTVGYKGRHVECAHANNADRRVIGRKQKCAASLVKKRGFRLYASRVHQR